MDKINRKFEVSLLAILLILVLLVSGCGSREEDVPVEPGDRSPAEDNPQDDTPDQPEEEEREENPDDPSFLPEDVNLAFLRNGNLWFLLGDGTEIKMTDTGDVAYFDWSPDRSKLVYFTDYQPGLSFDDPDGGADLWVMNADGSGKNLLDSGVKLYGGAYQDENGQWRVDVFGWAGAWLPNNNSMIYAVEEGNGYQEIIRLSRAAGGHEEEFLIPSGPARVIQGPVWQPQGSRFAYAIERENENRVIIQQTGDSKVIKNSYSPCWYRDGSRLVMVSYEIFESGFYGFSALNSYNPDNDTVQPLFQEQIAVQYPEIGIAPSGQYLSLADYSSLLMIDSGSGDSLPLVTQDVMTTYSEYSYPPVYQWDYQSDRLVVLAFFQTGESDSGVEGYWDLLIANAATNQVQSRLHQVYRLNEGNATPMYIPRPVVWAKDGNSLYLLQESEDSGGFDIWQVDVGGSSHPQKVVTNSGYWFE